MLENRFIGRYLTQRHRRIADAVVIHSHGSHLQGVGTKAQARLALLAPELGTVFLAFPLDFAQ